MFRKVSRYEFRGLVRSPMAEWLVWLPLLSIVGCVGAITYVLAKCGEVSVETLLVYVKSKTLK
ncbi:MAG: hypothetical protein EAZ24_02415 [Burkholderiales bacterium]|nr:MAG: hypothetical protein EAZ21_04815 [Betaproteobacteria bacterium]TAG83933.1 MAG: hypothetical protein EAZ24_02415 [Burkholderiales bacterium]